MIIKKPTKNAIKPMELNDENNILLQKLLYSSIENCSNGSKVSIFYNEHAGT